MSGRALNVLRALYLTETFRMHARRPRLTMLHSAAATAAAAAVEAAQLPAEPQHLSALWCRLPAAATVLP